MWVGFFTLVRPGRPRSRASRGLAWLALLGTLALGIRAHAGEALGFDLALRLAQERSRQLPAQDAAGLAAREMAVAARQLPDPTLKAGINNLPINGQDRFSLTRDFMTMRSVGVAQEFTGEEKRQARAARFEREADAAQAKRTLALASLQRDTATAWLDRYYQERMREVLLTQRDEAKRLIEAADAAYRGGRGSQADVFAARSGVAQIEDRIAQTQRQIATATTQLARWAGDIHAQPLGPPPNTDAVPLEANGLEAVLLHHPQIEVMARQEDAALAEVGVARAGKRGDWSAELMYSQRGPGYSDMVSITVSVPLQWDQAHRQDRELAARIALAAQVRDEREEATREYLAQVRAMLQEWQGERERIGRYGSSIIPLAAERQRAALAAYRGGSGSLAAVLDARRGEIDTRMDRLRLEMNAARLWAQLNFLVPRAPHEVAMARP